MAARRTSFRTISQMDVDYYTSQERQNPGLTRYPFVCHACGTRLTAGQRWCYLLNTTNDNLIWGRCCAQGFPVEEGY